MPLVLEAKYLWWNAVSSPKLKLIIITLWLVYAVVVFFTLICWFFTLLQPSSILVLDIWQLVLCLLLIYLIFI